MIATCDICPRKCGVIRETTIPSGYCGAGTNVRVARAAAHMWEEPPISGTRGSGTVFFSGCNLRCVYCQNYDISQQGAGKDISVSRLSEIFSELVNSGVHNINLVTGTHFLPSIIDALNNPLPVPVVWNSSAYETVQSLALLDGKVQIYIPDMKYALDDIAGKYSSASDYPDIAKAAILEMYRQTSDYVIDSNGIMQSGVIIRHLVLPGNLDNSRRVIDWVSSTFTPGQILFSLMSQFTPFHRACEFSELNRRLTEDEYSEIIAYMESSGIEDGFFQELSSASEEYTPPFDLTGV